MKALSSRPNVAMTIDVGDTPTEAKALLVRGLATVDIVNGVPDEYIAASRKALDAAQVPEFERSVRSLYDQMMYGPALDQLVQAEKNYPGSNVLDGVVVWQGKAQLAQEAVRRA